MPETELITDPAPESPSELPVNLGVADDIISGLNGRLSGLEANTPTGYEAVRAGISEVRTLRTGVEKSRKALKQSALEWGRKVDAEAKRITDMLLAIETPLKLTKKSVDDERARVKQESQERAQREADALAEKARLEREQKEQAERERVRAEQEAREKEIAEQRAKLQAEEEEHARKVAAAKAKVEAERQALEADRAKLEAEKREAEEAKLRKKAEAERIKREKAEAAEQKKREAEEARQKAIREKEEAERLEAERIEAERIAEERKPDAQKLAEFAAAIRGLERLSPELKTEWGHGVLAVTIDNLRLIAQHLEVHVPSPLGETHADDTDSVS